ncbi:hypothetical protein PAL_GLEAN10002771 [Pteropus alecto]|uniref:Telomerase RNA component interacting RNase n=1 Tax=Pteropus alecto TaxID=9402 RepID=L5K7E2_PTEAL|nr:hypothetical protein PAL_GLEAN10002771 [Pteropus alecto]
MAARGRRAEPPGREAPGPAAGGGGGSRWAESGPGTSPESGDEELSSPVSCGVGKRRGGNKLALKTGIVAKKQKTEDEVLTSKGDAWAKYMAEVKKYKAHQCGDDDKTRPLVK